MSEKIRWLGIVCAVLAFLFCLSGGRWLLRAAGFDSGEGAIYTGIGLYFIGKAFFVGPMLLIVAMQTAKHTR